MSYFDLWALFFNLERFIIAFIKDLFRRGFSFPLLFCYLLWCMIIKYFYKVFSYLSKSPLKEQLIKSFLRILIEIVCNNFLGFLLLKRCFPHRLNKMMMITKTSFNSPFDTLLFKITTLLFKISCRLLNLFPIEFVLIRKYVF